MTAPRQVVPGRTQLITRRCTQRQFLLRPEPIVEDIFLYCLAEAAHRYRVAIHAWIVMSNHCHVLLRDNEGNFPQFLAHLNKMTAKALNRHWGRWENFWSTEQPNAVYVVDAQDRFDKLLYILANPVSADLVDRVGDWPGASSLSVNLSGKTLKLDRPRVFFRKDELGGRMPPQVELRVERIDGFAQLSEDEWRTKILSALRVEEACARERRRARGIRVVGRRRVLSALPTDTPRTLTERRKLKPSVACRDEVRRIGELLAIRAFRIAHRAALDRWSAGERDIEFPAGTYRMRRFGARCAVPPPLVAHA